MLKKAVFVILCLMTHQVCMKFIQPRTDERNIPESFTELISDGIKNEMKKCNISIPDDVIDVCSLSIRPLRDSYYFYYDEALCITLNDFAERLSGLCNGKKLPKLQLERSDPDVKDISVSLLCGKMRSVLNDTFSDTKDSERKEWIIALKNKLNDEKMCKDACIHSDGINPVCLTLLQINSHLISNFSEKLNTSPTSDDSETTSINNKQNVFNIQKAASDLLQGDIKARLEIILKNTSLHVEQGKGQQDQVISVQKDDTQDLPTENSHKYILVNTEPTVSTISNKDKVEKKDNIKISEKEIPVNKPVNRKHHINDTAVKEVTLSKQSSNTHKTNDHIMKKPSSDTLKMNVDSKITKPPPSNPNEAIEDPTSNKLSLENYKDLDANENNKDLEKKKQLPIPGDTNEITDKPSLKLEDDNKETNLNKPPANAKENDKMPLPKPEIDIPKDKNSDDKTENSPEGSQVSKTQSSDKSKTVIDSSTKKMSVPKTDDAMEQTQAQSPDIESEITEKDPNIFDENISNEEAGEKNIGENDGTIIDSEEPNTMISDDNDNNNVVQNKNILPEIDEIVKNTPEKGPYTHTFVNAEDSHFFAYFMTMVIICIIGYLVYHNKQKILALALEGRSRKSTRRRPNTSGYRKLDSNLEEAVTSACSTSVTHVIY